MNDISGCQFSTITSRKMLKYVVVLFTANFSVTIKRLTRYKQVAVLATMLEDKVVALQHGGQYKSYTILIHYLCHSLSRVVEL